MKIAWIYLDKKTAAIDVLKDYYTMQYIIHSHCADLEEARERLEDVPAAKLSGMPKVKNPHAYETRLASSLDEIDVLKERYRRALEYMEWFQPSWDALSDEERLILTEFFLRDDIRACSH